MNVKKNIKIISQKKKKCFSVFEGAPFTPFKHTMTFSAKCLKNFFFNIHKKNIWYQFKIFSQKYASIFFLTARSPNCSVSAKFFQMLVKTLFFGGIIIKKNLLKTWARLQVFFPLSSLAYKLMNLLVFERKKSYKMSKNWFYFLIIGLVLNFTYELKVCFSVHGTIK